MPRSERDFWDSPKQWSRRKHLVLRYYLEPAAAKLGAIAPNRRVIVVDGYAGRGRYEDGEAGSPIVTGELTRICQKWSDPVRLQVINIEPNPDAYKRLCEATDGYAQSGALDNRHGSFRDLLPEVLLYAGDAPLFAFLDPFRPTQLRIPDIAPLLNRRAPTEVCVVVHTPAIVRMLGAVRATVSGSAQSRETQSRTLEGVLGQPAWQALSGLAHVASEDVLKALTDWIAGCGTADRRWVLWHEVYARHRVGLKYHLLFVTRHPEGVRLMNDAFHKESEAAYSEIPHAATGRLDLGLDDEPPIERPPEQRSKDLIEQILMICGEAAQQNWRRKDLQFASIVRRFGDYSCTEHLRALRALVGRTNPPRLIPVDQRPTRKGGWRTNDDTKLRYEG